MKKWNLPFDKDGKKGLNEIPLTHDVHFHEESFLDWVHKDEVIVSLSQSLAKHRNHSHKLCSGPSDRLLHCVYKRKKVMLRKHLKLKSGFNADLPGAGI